MNIFTRITADKRPYIVALFALLSILLTMYGPMASYSQAQAVNAANMESLRSKVLGEIDRRVTNYEKTITSLSENIKASASKSADDGSISGEGLDNSSKDKEGGSYNFTVDATGIHGDVYVGTALKEKVKGLMQKIVDGLKATAQKVKDSKTMDKLKSFAANIDTQFIVNQLTQVQATATQAADSMTNVITKLKEGYNNLQKRVALFEQCMKKKATPNVAASANTDCSDFKSMNQETLTNVKEQLKNVGSIVMTIGSVVTSVVTLSLSLVSQFSTLTSSLGDLGNLGNITNLGSQLGNTDALSGLTSSFSGILSQLGLAGSMASTTQSGLSSIADLINQ